MPDINPNPHEYGYVFIPINRITALFASENDLREAVKELFSAGFAPENLDIFVGEQGADALDLTGEGHGTVTRRVRNFEALMVQVAGDSHQRADEALRAGGAAVAVLLDGKETMKNQVGSHPETASGDRHPLLGPLDDRITGLDVRCMASRPAGRKVDRRRSMPTSAEVWVAHRGHHHGGGGVRDPA